MADNPGLDLMNVVERDIQTLKEDFQKRIDTLEEWFNAAKEERLYRIVSRLVERFDGLEHKVNHLLAGRDSIEPDVEPTDGV